MDGWPFHRQTATSPKILFPGSKISYDSLNSIFKYDLFKKSSRISTYTFDYISRNGQFGKMSDVSNFWPLQIRYQKILCGYSFGCKNLLIQLSHTMKFHNCHHANKQALAAYHILSGKMTMLHVNVSRELWIGFPLPIMAIMEWLH